jgi:hypothetical protein
VGEYFEGRERKDTWGGGRLKEAQREISKFVVFNVYIRAIKLMR